ncbi:MAG TPA: aromatic prenyltransferase [Polyangiaceae bacterium]|nr:aromatic prenyltransferase [Polyangiaceae bacterium]
MNATILSAAQSRASARLMNDLVTCARHAGVIADRAKIAEGLALFADRFASKPVEIRTTSQPLAKREVSFRFVDEDARGEVWNIASDWYEIEGEPRAFMDAITSAFGIRAEGLDCDVRGGFRKVWAFLDQGFRSERFERLPGAPPALVRVRSVLERYGLQHMSIVGIDPANRTCNLYPILRPGWATPEVVASVARELSFNGMAEGWLQHIERSVAANFTFAWDSERVERLAFYRPAMSPEELPDDELLRQFALRCPTVATQRAYIPSVAYASSGHYRKVEVDYDGGIVPVLVRCAQVPNEAP